MAGRIVVGTDGSIGSRSALRWAAEEARLRGASIDLVHAWSPELLPWSSPIYSAAAGATYEEEVVLPPIENVRRNVQSALKEILTAEGLLGNDPPTQGLEVEGPSGKSLVEAARDADLLVVGARGLGEIRGLFLGSVSLYCVTHAGCPVVVVRDHGPDDDSASTES